ncbi:hypothetical protein ACPV36_04855 [Photobacterium damselae]|uniref:hypothetical protein n=1 Tax=Photobacterium damselae TaxID=38293 RepID=UPI004067B439
MFTVNDLNTPEMQALDKGIAILAHKYVNGQHVITAAIKQRTSVVRDRINAVRWCKDTFGFECSDGVIAGMASETLSFGTLKGDLTLNENGDLVGELEVVDHQRLPVDYIVDNFEYDDFIMLSLLMGKPTPSSESNQESSEQSSSVPVTNESE